MRLVEVDPYDDGQLERLTALDELVRVHDDPEAFVQTVEDHAIELRHGGDLNPSRATLLLDDTGEVVGAFWIDVPVLDNRHLVEAHLRVRPDRRDEGLQVVVLEELASRTRALGRTTLWVGVGADDVRMTALLAERGFALAAGTPGATRCSLTSTRPRSTASGATPPGTRATTGSNGSTRPTTTPTWPS